MYHLVLPPPNGGVLHTDALEVVLARLLQSVDTIAAIMLQMAEADVDGVGGADTAQAAQREVVVQDQGLLRVVEALHVLTGLRVVGAPVHVLEHVQVGRDGGEVLRLVQVRHLVHEVDVAEVPAGPRLVLHLQRRLHRLLHHLGPVVVLDRHDHLVDVQQRDIFIPENCDLIDRCFALI